MFGTSERILTTHAGSLPRPPDLLQMMYDRGAGKPVDGAALEARIRSAVEEIVARQREIGLDLISDGEMSKSGFSTYIYERLSGFAGQGQFYANDMADFPDLAMRLFATPASALIVMPDCEGAIEPRNEQAVQRDVANFKATLGSTAEGAFDVLTNHVEHPRLVAQRIEQFAGIVGRERVIAGTDCGFGTFAGWSACDPAVAWLKLQALVDGAGEASRALFGGSVVPV